MGAGRGPAHAPAATREEAPHHRARGLRGRPPGGLGPAPRLHDRPHRQQGRLPHHRRRLGEGPPVPGDDAGPEGPVHRVPQRLPGQGRLRLLPQGPVLRQRRQQPHPAPPLPAGAVLRRAAPRDLRHAGHHEEAVRQAPHALPPALRQLQPGHPGRRQVLRHQVRADLERGGLRRPLGVPRGRPAAAPRRHRAHPLPGARRLGRHDGRRHAPLPQQGHPRGLRRGPPGGLPVSRPGDPR
ncbi:hypothetical protein SGPA1_12459 [Streptomyces misionensis JCM 4497]